MNRSIVISGLFAFATCMGALAQPVQTWGRYMDLTVNTTATGGGANVSAGVTNFPLLVRLDSANAATVLAQALPGGADVRFADSVGNKIPHEIESWGATVALIWVRVPAIAANASTRIRLYWGKAGAANESNGAAVFSTANGYEAVFHMNEAPGDTIRDVTANGFKGVPVVGATAGSTAPTSVAGPIGVAKAFGGNITNTADGALTGGAYRLETATGGNTYSSFDYTGTNAEFTISVWTNFSAYPADFPRRRGIITKADHGTNQLDNNDPLTQWFLRPNITARVMHFQRVAAVGYGTAPYSIVESGGLAGVLNTWNFVSFAANGAGVDDNRFRMYNPTASTFRTLADEAGVHQDVDVFIGGFASNSGAGGQKSGGTHFLNGMVDEVRISNVARSAAWTDLEYATQRPGATAVTYGTAQNNDTSRVFLYPIRSASYLINQAISSVTPYVKAGNTVTAYAIAPALPTGLAFSTTTGVISGTPTVASAAAAYIVTATIGGNPHRDTLTFTVTSGTPPGAPASVTATAGAGQATVTWSAATAGTAAITSYTARATQDTTKTCTWTTGALSCVITGLTNGTAYTFVVRATSSAGTGAFSAPSASVTPATVPGAPTNVLATQGSAANSAVLTWSVPASNGGLPITDYYATSSPGGLLCYSPAVANPTCTVTGLAGGTAYTFTVLAANARGNGPASAPSGPIVVGTSILPGSFAIHVTGSSKPFAFTLTPEAIASTEALTMSIMDMQGRTVWSKTVNPAKDGTRELSWNGVSSTGRAVSAGVYMVRVATVTGGNTADFIRPAVSVK